MEAKKSEEGQKFTTIQQDAHIRRVELESKPTEVSNRTESNEIIVVAPIDNRANDITECVQNKMHRACPDLQFFHPEQFVDMFYPWFEPGTAPESKEDLQKALPQLKERFNQIAELLIEVRKMPKEELEPSLASEQLFAELARLYEMPGGREQIESAQKDAIQNLKMAR